ncbi:MAG: HAD-IIB family hydrolase [Candidatus Vogelbacteria bacterium]|nr:HAD-IIB family hydrolase [Candidatus Vogelbacteria bacterium]
MKPLEQMTAKDLSQIKMVVFDVDGVLVPRGTKIKQVGDITTLQTKVISDREIEQIRQLNELGFLVNISSGRGLYMLQEMFRGILPFVSLTYENGSATWYHGKIYQHVNSFEKTKDIFSKLKAVALNHPDFKGFEPKEFIITIHCEKQIKEIEDVVAQDKDLTTVWNGEAYDILIKKDQTKAVGLSETMKIFKLKKKNVMAIGDNYNDAELLQASGTPVSADKSRVEGKFYVPLEGEFLPADNLMQKIISLKKS